MKIKTVLIFLLLCIAATVTGQRDRVILDPPFVGIAPCPVHVVLEFEIKAALHDLKKRGCDNKTVIRSQHSEAHFIVYGVWVVERPMR